MWALRAKTQAHAYAMHMLVRHHICAHVSRRILTLEIASSVRAAYKALWHVAVALTDLGAACTVHIGYACAPCTLAMHVPTDTKPQHVKTMEILRNFQHANPLIGPVHRSNPAEPWSGSPRKGSLVFARLAFFFWEMFFF